jgi:threonine/homoserine/homoserine lactone efflux protein
MRRTLANGFEAGVLSGLGIASADAVYGAVAAFGLVAIADFLVGHSTWLRLVGGAALLYLGLGTIRARPAEKAAAPARDGSASIYASMLALTLTNPTTILSFAALFAGLGLGAGGRDVTAAVLIVLGVFLGSALWWLCLTGVLTSLRHSLNGRVLRTVNVLAGLALIAFGIVALASVLPRP